MAGGLSNTHKLVNVFEDEKVEKRCPTDYELEHEVEIKDNSAGGGTNFGDAWIYDGSGWTAIEPMSSVRVSPVCSLVEMDDGEVFSKYLYI